MARRRKSEGGSGVVAGLIVAAVAFFFFVRYMEAQHKISFDAETGVNPPMPGDFFEYEVPGWFGLPATRTRVVFDPDAN